MEFKLDDAKEILRRTPTTLAALLDGLPENWVEADEGPETFSPFEVVGHLLHGEHTDWIPRARLILGSGAERPFEPFDRFAHRELSRSVPLERLLAQFAAARQDNLAALEEMTLEESDLDRRGTHPELGSVTLRQLIAAWVVHDLGHLAQVSRVMAKQYSQAVGPWTPYMPVLSNRTG